MENVEGQYFVFMFSADFIEDDEGLAVLQVKNGRLEEKLHPCDSSVWNIISHDNDEKVITYLKKLKVKSVFTTYNFPSPRKLFGRELDVDNEEGWYQYAGIYEPHWCERFKEECIELKLFNEYD